MKYKKIVVRAAANIAGSASADTDAVTIRGATHVFFVLSATDADTLASGTLIQTSNNGTNWSSTAAGNAANGWAYSATTGVITTAMNANPITYELFSVEPGGVTLAGKPFSSLYARVHLVAGASQIDGLSVTAYVGYDDGGPTSVLTLTNDGGPNT